MKATAVNKSKSETELKMDAKRIAAEKAVSYVADGMLVGLGTGSTASFAIRALGDRVAAGLRIRTVASSLASERLAEECGIPVVGFERISEIDLTIDGADEIDQHHHLIKGGGGALLREKILAYNSKRFLVVADASKLVTVLGNYPLPVEIVAFASELTLRQLSAMGAKVMIRHLNGNKFFTDNNNLVADCSFGHIADPAALEASLKSIPGVVETGLFLKQHVSQVIIGYDDGRVVIRSGNSTP